jgi:hypothetical protein
MQALLQGASEEREMMTDKQPEALRLAACLEEPDHCTILQMRQAAAELRRLHEVNAELVEALKEMVLDYEAEGYPQDILCVIARAAIAKATGEQQ